MLSTAAVLGVVLWHGFSPAPVLLAFIALRHPVPALVGAAGWAVYQRFHKVGGPDPDDEARFLEGVVTELHGGASPRAAVIHASSREHVIDLRRAVRAATLGLDPRRLAAGLAEALPFNGRLAGAAWAISSESGAPFAPVMQLLAYRAAQRGRLHRETRALTAQARATAWIVAGVPMALFTGLVATGSVDVGPSLPIAIVGLGLQAVGVGVVVLMLRASA